METTRNISDYPSFDEFKCEECGICVSNYVRVEYDEDTNDENLFAYEFKFCPECGRKIV